MKTKWMLLLALSGLMAWASRPASAQSPDSLRLQAFYQGQTGNCASVAVIKAAIDYYGVGQVFDTLRTGNTLQVRLRDHQQVLTLTDAERRQAAAAAMFVRNDSSVPEGTLLPAAEGAAVIRYATLCYAVMAKYIETVGEYGCLSKRNQTAAPVRAATFTAALSTMADGICSDNCYRHLGLTVEAPQHVEFNPALAFTDKRGVVVYSNRHAVFLLRKYFDFHGDWIMRSATGHCQTDWFKARYYFVLR